MNSVNSARELEDKGNEERPFNMPWLDSSFYETLLPQTPWQNISDMLCADLAEVVKQQFKNPHRKQMLIELLGTQFKRSYLPDEEENPSILHPPSLSEDQRKKLENEAKSWLQLQINDIALRRRCALRSTDQNEENLSSEMKDYLEHTYNVVSTSLDRHLYILQNKIYTNPEVKLNKQDVNDLREAIKYKINLNNGLNFNGQLQKGIQTNLTTEYSEIIGESLLLILQKDPRKIAFVLQKLIGQQLSNNLRKFIWSDILLRHERKKLHPTVVPLDIDFVVRKNFANGVTRGKQELKIIDPSSTPVSNLIENAVIETYSRVFALNEYLDEVHLRQTIKILNVLYTYSKDYEAYFIYWLLPFQIAFQNDKSKSELIYDLAMYLDLFVKNLFPPWNEIFTIASKVMQDLAVNDPEFYDHLNLICNVNPRINPRDFVSEIIYNESKRAIMQRNIAAGENLIKPNKELLTSPVIFLRKWIGEAFSGVLSKNALLYVWDQLFMSLWSPREFEMISKCLLYLLRVQFMKAQDHDEMRRIFLEEPCRLLTADIQSAYMHLSSGRNESEIPSLNKKAYEFIYNKTGYYAKPDQSLSKRKYNFDPIGMKNIHLKLVVPKTGVTSDFDPTKVFIEANLYYGDKKIGQKNSQSIPIVKDITSSILDTKTYELNLLNDKIVFDIFEIRQEQKPIDLVKSIFTLILVKYHTMLSSEVVLGYCKLPLYTPDVVGKLQTWDVMHGDIIRLLHPGPQPENLEHIGEFASSTYKDRLGPGSNITFTVFEPKNEAHLTYNRI